MKTIGKIDNFPLYIIVAIILAIIVIPGVFRSTSDLRVWNGAIKNSDSFVLSHADEHYARLILCDQNDEVVCEVLLSHYDKESSIWRGGSLIGSSFNKKKSKKLYKLLYEKIPEDKRPSYPTKDEVIKYFRQKK